MFKCKTRMKRLLLCVLWLIIVPLQNDAAGVVVSSHQSSQGDSNSNNEISTLEDEENHCDFWSVMLPALQEAIIDASFPQQKQQQQQQARTTTGIENSKQRGCHYWKDKWKSMKNSFGDVASTVSSSSGIAASSADSTSAAIAAAASVAASIERELEESGSDSGIINHKISISKSPSSLLEDERTTIMKQKKKKAGMPHHNGQQQERQKVLQDFEEEREGAKLLSASFRVVANTFGLLADSVRLVGQTAGGGAGSSAKLVGKAIRTLSLGLDTVSDVLDTSMLEEEIEVNGDGNTLENKQLKQQQQHRRKPLTSERLMDRQRGLHIDDEYDESATKLVQNTRHVAAQSVRLLGNVVRGVGDSFVMIGVATESLAASTAGVAEDAVRIVENFAGSLSVTLSPSPPDKYNQTISKEPSLQQTKNEGEESISNEFLKNFDGVKEETTYISYGSYNNYYDTDMSLRDDESVRPTKLRHELRWDNHKLIIMFVFDTIIDHARDLWQFVMSDTGGHSSLAKELLGVFFLCYVASILILSPQSKRKSENKGGIIKSEIQTSRSSMDLHMSAPTKDIDKVEQNDVDRVDKIQTLKFLFQPLRVVIALPWSYLCTVVRVTIRVVFSGHMILLLIYFIAWLYVSRKSQIRSLNIQRVSEAIGYRSAVASIGTTSPAVDESVVWLNAAINQAWRVSYNPKLNSQTWDRALHQYPPYVSRVMENILRKRSNDDDIVSNSYYGGLEPYISTHIGSSLMYYLDASKAFKPDDVAYVSLFSLTVGESPPLIRSVQFKGSKDKEKVTQFLVDVDAMLDDFELVLEVKLSSLEYSLLPSTKISVESIECSLPLFLELSFQPDYPFVSLLRVSLTKLPDCKIRITPLSDDSGLRGVDLSSLPVINEWVREAIRETLLEYVTPKYVSVDLAELIFPSTRVSSATTDTKVDLTHLRKKTKHSLNTNPRTSVGGGVSSNFLSVADKLSSRRSSTCAVDQQIMDELSSRGVTEQRIGRVSPISARPPTTLLVKPKNENKLAQMGLERWTEHEKLRRIENQKVEDPGGLTTVVSKSMGTFIPFILALASETFRSKVAEEKKELIDT